MIEPPGVRRKHWQSPDGMVEAGEAQVGDFTYAYLNLGPRLASCADIQALIQFLKETSTARPLLLLSSCPGFELSLSEEAEGLVFYAGAYRALLQERKASGGLILSYIEQIAVGGVYLMHGLAAQHRAAAEGTLFYDTVPSRPPVTLAQAQARGLLDQIIPQHLLESWLLAAVEQHGAPTQA
jgi:hypothetical protein